MNTDIHPPVPAAVRDLMSDLRLSDEQTGGLPVLAPAQVDAARVWVAHPRPQRRAGRHGIVVDILPRSPVHVADAAPRAAGPNHLRRAAGGLAIANCCRRRAEAVVERGPAALEPGELACLLLNPFVLWDLADLIGVVLLPYWLPELDRAGEELLASCGVDLSVPGEGDEHVTEKEDLTLALVERGRALPGQSIGRERHLAAVVRG
jgi:hypothetical protein